MGSLSRQQQIATGEVVWYLSGGLDDHERLEFARSSGGAVFKGLRGAHAAKRLRDGGFSGRVWLDPAAYESTTPHEQPPLFGDAWLDRQQELAVVEMISPGVYVPVAASETLTRALETEHSWLDAAGRGRLSLALHARWLVDGIEELIEALHDVDVPLALAFADRNDPLGVAGAVNGLIALLAEVPDVALLRCDLGAIGAVAHGASLSAIGTSATVRHVVPPGETAGGVPRDRSPSVFVQDLLDFKLGSHLDEFPRKASPTCDFECCRGGALRRFNDEHTLLDARVHNRVAIRELVATILGTPPETRPAAFRTMCRQAEYAVEELAVKARRPLRVRPQIKAWAQLD